MSGSSGRASWAAAGLVAGFIELFIDGRDGNLRGARIYFGFLARAADGCVPAGEARTLLKEKRGTAVPPEFVSVFDEGHREPK